MCEHTDFVTWAKIARLTESEVDKKVIGFRADIKINCTQCGQAFEFCGIPGGYHPSHPTVSFDSTELRVPLRPSNSPIERDPNKVYN